MPYTTVPEYVEPYCIVQYHAIPYHTRLHLTAAIRHDILRYNVIRKKENEMTTYQTGFNMIQYDTIPYHTVIYGNL